MTAFAITILSPGKDEYLFNGVLGAKSPKLSKTQCTVFNNREDALYTVAQIIEKHPQFEGFLNVLELTPIN